jgi:hypothetical protein
MEEDEGNIYTGNRLQRKKKKETPRRKVEIKLV